MYKVGLHQPALIRKNERLYIDMDISVLCQNIEPDCCVVLTPLLSWGEYSRELPLVIINGKKRHRNFKHLRNHFRDYQIYKAMLAVDHSPLWCSYQVHIPYQDWMNEAKLSLIAN